MSQQARFVNGDSIGTVRDWILAHNADYASVRDRLEAVRNVVLHGRIEASARTLKRSYLFAVMSIQTDRDRHERAFTAHFAGDKPLKDACLDTVYGGQKYGWIESTFDSVDFRNLATAVRHHMREGSHAELLDIVVSDLTGVSHRKGAFMLAMAGMHEFMCVDSNVARHAGLEKDVEFDSASEYMDLCHDIVESVGFPRLPPFMVQWSIYDFQRGEHSRHMAYFREVLAL